MSITFYVSEKECAKKGRTTSVFGSIWMNLSDWWLKKGNDKIMGIENRYKESLKKELSSEFEGLKDFYDHASKNNKGVIVSIY